MHCYASFISHLDLDYCMQNEGPDDVNPNQPNPNRRQIVFGGLAAAGRRVLGGAAVGGSAVALGTIGEFVFGDIAFAAGIPGSDSSEYKAEIKRFYKYLFDESEGAEDFHRVMREVGNRGTSTAVNLKGDKLQQALNKFPLIKQKNIQMLTVTLTGQPDGSVLIVTVLQDNEKRTNTNTVFGKPRSEFGASKKH